MCVVHGETSLIALHLGDQMCEAFSLCQIHECSRSIVTKLGKEAPEEHQFFKNTKLWKRLGQVFV